MNTATGFHIVTAWRATGIALCVVSTYFGLCFAGEKAGPAHLAAPDEFAVPSLAWEEVTSAARTHVLEILADSARGNYEKIRTWSGTYSIDSLEHLEKEYLTSLFRGQIKPEDVVPLTKGIRFKMPFAIDAASGSIYRSKEGCVVRWTRTASGQEVKVPPRQEVEQRSVVTSEHYLHFDPKSVWDGFREIEGNPAARGKRAAFRDPTENVGKMHLGDLPEPRTFFGLGDAAQKSWDIPRMNLEALAGKHGEESRKLMNEIMTVYQASGPGGQWYRMSMRLDNGRLHLNTIWSPEAGFNLVHFTMVTKNGGERPLAEMFVRWKETDGVYVPVAVKESLYSRKSGEPTVERNAHLEKYAVNRPIAPSQFSYAGLGMRDGDLMKDSIEKAFYVIEGGKPVKLANFGDKYTPPKTASQTSRGALPRGWRIAICLGMLVLLLTAFLLRWHRKRGRLADVG